MRSGASIFRENSPAFEPPFVEALELPMTTLDTLFGQGPEFQLVKIDTGGSELGILKGGEHTIQRAELILLKASVLPINREAPSLADLILELRRLGFQLVDVADVEYEVSTGAAPNAGTGAARQVAQVSALFAKNSSRFAHPLQPEEAMASTYSQELEAAR
ncbi:unnamed protein product [Polarella glacialis]|uniref:Methyltransferase FkbM domain-containing protein n=1 Tax=Polarella glacialis TaxID=89957 RepID=A0A813IMI1_POLGL|nr:unnamed protein product [Polarella glacialis]